MEIIPIGPQKPLPRPNATNELAISHSNPLDFTLYILPEKNSNASLKNKLNPYVSPFL